MSVLRPLGPIPTHTQSSAPGTARPSAVQGTPRFCSRAPGPSTSSRLPGLPPEWQAQARTLAPTRRLRGSPAFHRPGHELPVTQLFCPVGHTEKSIQWLGGMDIGSNSAQEARAGNPGTGGISRPSTPCTSCPTPPKCHLPNWPSSPSGFSKLLLILQSPEPKGPSSIMLLFQKQPRVSPLALSTHRRHCLCGS